MTDRHFGECPYCDGYIQRPFWDTCCFDCQDELREERLREEDHFYYAVPTLCEASRAANSHKEPT